MEIALMHLQSENEIRDLVSRYCFALDSRDRVALRACWTDQITMDVPALGQGIPARQDSYNADELSVGTIALMNEFSVTQHCCTNHLISVTADTASCKCYVIATHLFDLSNEDPWITIGAQYDLTLQQCDGKWRINTFKWTQLWSRGNDRIWAVATERAAAKLVNQ